MRPTAGGGLVKTEVGQCRCHGVHVDALSILAKPSWCESCVSLSGVATEPSHSTVRWVGISAPSTTSRFTWRHELVTREAREYRYLHSALSLVIECP
jgi:hypothetical protein